jgi:hypothetical protein
MTIHGWYISAAAVKQYMRICGLPPQDEGAAFDRTAVALQEICQGARLKSDPGPGSGRSQSWEAKTTIDGLVARLALSVRTSPRSEGPAAQLVRVRRKGGSRSGKKR